MPGLQAVRKPPLVFTGESPFLRANEYFAAALTAASSHCVIHAAEDIFDRNGLKLWARGKPIDAHLLERLADRALRKPIELCVYAHDPVKSAAIVETVERCVARSPELAAVLAPQMAALVHSLHNITPNPSELLFVSVLRHGGRDRFEHAAAVTAVALAVAADVGLSFDAVRHLARASLLHDVGDLYFDYDESSLDAARAHIQHPMLGARVAVELAHCDATVGELIATSHERLDGSGYPRALRAAELPLPAQVLLFAEAITAILNRGDGGSQRTAVRTQLVLGEFPRSMVDWLAMRNRSRPGSVRCLAGAEAIGARLREIHGQLARLLVLLSMPFSEAPEVRAMAAQWKATLDNVAHALRTSGVEEALVLGMNVVPETSVEAAELGALCDELHSRSISLRTRIELLRADHLDFASSRLVQQLLDILPTAPAPITSTESPTLH